MSRNNRYSPTTTGNGRYTPVLEQEANPFELSSQSNIAVAPWKPQPKLTVAPWQAKPKLTVAPAPKVQPKITVGQAPTPQPISVKTSNTKPFNATYYDPRDPFQTRPEADGIGAFNTPVVFGDVATGQRNIPQGTLIKVPELADVQTPYGMGVFRVNDKKNKRYDTPDTPNFDIALPAGTPNREALQKRIGNNIMNFEHPQPEIDVTGAPPSPEKKSGFAGFIDSMTSWDSEDIPYYGSGKEAIGNVGVVLAFNKIKKGTATEADKKKVENYYKEEEREGKKRENIGYNVGEIMKTSLRFMGELLPAVVSEIATLGIAPTGDMMILSAASKAGARKTLDRMVKDKVYRTVVTDSIKGIAKKESILLAKQFAITAPTNVTLGGAQRMIGDVNIETGEVYDEGQPIGEAFVNSLTAHAVELLTERGGGVTGKIFKTMTAPVRKIIIKNAIFQAIKKRIPGATNAQIVSLLKKTGWNGPMGEWFEERDADALNQALFSVGLGDQEFQGLTVEQITSEIIAFSLMGVGGSVISNEKVGGRLFGAQQDKTPTPPPDGGGGKQNQIVNQDIVDPLASTPTTKLSGKDFIEVEIPVAKAVDVIPDTVSSGFMEKFSKEFNGINPSWAITVEGKSDSKIINAIKGTGLKLNVRQPIKENKDYFLTDIYLPDVPQSDLKKSQEVFDKFSKNYSQSSKGVGQLAKEYEATGPGHKKLSNYLATMVRNGTALEEDAVILKALFEGTNDKMLEDINFSDNSRLTRSLGRFVARKGMSGVVPGSQKLQMQKGLAEKEMATASRVFLHEFGHAGYHLILNQSEREIVEDVFNEMGRNERIKHFAEVGGNVNYYAKDSQEFFAESFANYIMENRVPAKQMEPLLKRMSKELFRRLKNLVNRQEVGAVKKLQTVYEKILAGDATTTLGQLAKEEPPSFKQELQKMLSSFPEEAGQPYPKIPDQKPLFPGEQPEITPEDAALFATEPGEGSPMDTAEAARQDAIANLPPDIASTIEPPEVVAQAAVNTPAVKRVNLLDKLRTPWRVMKKFGVAQEYRGLIGAYEKYIKELPGNINKIKAWSKRVSKESNEKIFIWLDGGKDIPLTTEELTVAKEIKTWLAQWADRLGLEEDSRISDYISHIFPQGKNGEVPEEIVSMIEGKTAKSIYDRFLLPRQGAKGYKRDTWAALDAYVKTGTRKANIDPALKEFNEATAHVTEVSQLRYIEKRVSALNMRPTNVETDVDNLIKAVMGEKLGARPTARVTLATRKMISRAKIGGSVTSLAKNLTQGVNTFAELGTRYTTRGYLDLVKFGAKELQENSVLISPFVEDRTYSAIKKWAEKFDRVLFMNMEASELLNRGAAYYGAKAKFLKGKITAKEYKLGLNKEMPANYEPTLEDAIAYGKFVAEKTQFLFGPLDSPSAITGPLARTAFQFQTFGLKQAEFVGQMAADKEFAKLARYLVSSMLVFQYIAGAFGMKWDDSFKTLRWGMPPAVQFLIDLWKGGILGEDNYGNKLDMGERAGLVGKSLFTNVVPGGAQMKRGYEGFQTVAQGKGTNASGKFQYKVDQTPSNYVRGTLFGKYNLPESKEYYKKKEAKAKGKSSGSREGRYSPQ